MGKKGKPTERWDELDRLQTALGIKLRRSDAFDFCYYHFWELMEFGMLLEPEFVRADRFGKLKPITYNEKRDLVKLLRAYDDATQTYGGVHLKYEPRVPLRHCLKSLERSFEKHFDDLIYITHI